MHRTGWKVVVGLVGLATGCSSSGRLVVQDGYRGVAAEPPIARAEPAELSRPAALTLAPTPTAPR